MGTGGEGISVPKQQTMHLSQEIGDAAADVSEQVAGAGLPPYHWGGAVEGLFQDSDGVKGVFPPETGSRDTEVTQQAPHPALATQA